MPELLYFEDFTVGQKFTNPATITMEASRIKEFAREFDPQPFHLDENAAATHPIFQGLSASGWHTASASARLMIESIPFADGLVGLGVEVTWLQPTRPGDVLSVETEVIALSLSRSGRRGVITIRTVTQNQRGEKLQIITSRALVPCRPGPV